MRIQALVAFIGSAQAFAAFRPNPFLTNWEREVAAMNCPYGPKRCGTDKEGNDVFCGEGQACFQPIEFGFTCKNAYQFQCVDNCREGQVNDPLSFCKCIDE